MTNFLLVHGAWHGGWCWRRVAKILRAAGHEVFAPTLTGLGEREHLLNADVGLDTHIADVLGVLKYEDLRDVVLVGHSYGGMVIAGAAEKAAERIAHLVYLDAFVPEDGKSLCDYQSPEILEMFHEKTRTEGEGYKLPCFIPAEVFGVTTDEDLAWVKPKLNPHPFKTKLDAVRLTNPEAARIPHTFIYCNNPAVGPFGQFADRIRDDESWQYLEMATGHDAMVTEPEKLAGMLIEIAETSSKAVARA
ncbi:MAG TPA: alpha/beta fold hydrolase [Pyrinomonadaceae bacterium]|jgi:pimeloyl-ACP methyl ester carboxylesterase|nr:putative esterase [Acidobacteriota bacterium]